MSVAAPSVAGMSTLTNRPHTALVVVDVQNGVVADAHDRDRVVANVATLVDRARAGQVPVVWVQHNAEDLPVGSDQWAYVPELPQAEGEPVVHKQFGDSFEETDLEDVLADAGVGHLVVAGAATDACIRSTIHGAVTRGYDVTLVGDAHTTGDLTSYGAPPPEAVIAHTNLYWSFHEVPGRTTAVVDTADVQFTGDTTMLRSTAIGTATTSTDTRSPVDRRLTANMSERNFMSHR